MLQDMIVEHRTNLTNVCRSKVVCVPSGTRAGDVMPPLLAFNHPQRTISGRPRAILKWPRGAHAILTCDLCSFIDWLGGGWLDPPSRLTYLSFAHCRSKTPRPGSLVVSPGSNSTTRLLTSGKRTRRCRPAQVRIRYPRKQ